MRTLISIFNLTGKQFKLEQFTKSKTDEEKKKKLPVLMPFFDRASYNMPKAQINFIEYFIDDMFEAWDGKKHYFFKICLK